MPPIRTSPGRWRARCALTGVLTVVAVLCAMLPAGARSGLNWITLPSLPTARYAPASAAAPCPRGQTGSCLYTVGGHGGTAVLATAESYNRSTNAWSTLANLPTPREALAAASAPCPDGQSGTCVYALGGNGPGVILATAQSYDPGTGAWSTVTSLPTARRYLAAASAPCPAGQTGTCVYALGGYGSKVLATVESFNPASRSWTTLASLPTARWALGAAAAPCPAGQTGICVYAVGGLGSSGDPTRTVESYNPVTRAWSQVTSLPTAQVAPGVAATSCPPGQTGTCVYSVGGTGPAAAVARSFNPVTRAWTTLPSLPTPRQEVGAAALPCPPGSTGNCVYIAGGYSGGALDTVEALDPPATTGR
ncbi:Kelch repeat-containing protein [Streptomyces griseoruber]